jgi:para-aminobenzoate synthetase component I
MERKKILLNSLDLANHAGWIKSLERHFKDGPFVVLNSNGMGDDYDVMIAAGAFSEVVPPQEGDAFLSLRNFHQQQKDWIFGYFSYDLKNNLEKLSSNNADGLNFPLLYFFCPKYLFLLKNGKLECYTKEDNTEAEIIRFFEEFEGSQNEVINQEEHITVKPRISRQEYIETINEIKQHIQLGDIYEMNFCQEFFAENQEVNPFNVFEKLIEASPTPFSCYLNANNMHLACASPERYIKKSGSHIFSQPIKGTIKRGRNAEEDEIQKKKLKNDPKEQSENVMIVDLVRNDLSRTAARGSVKVDELFGIYTFKQVHHMISTISSTLEEGFDFVDVFKTTFPMGSMTGAPKIRAMEIIEQYESMKRGLFSGAVGYVKPNGDFDFNVVIRSIFYNAKNKYLSLMVGSAITINAVPENEYDECALKAKAIFSLFKQTDKSS